MELNSEKEIAFVKDAKRRGKTKEETMAKLANLRASGYFRKDGEKPAEKKEEKPVEEKPEMSTGRSFLTGAQKFLDGATFGLGDEIWSGAESLFDDKSYDEHLAENRADEDQYAKEHPAWNLASELIGGLATGGLGVTKVAGAKALPFIAPSGAKGAVGKALANVGLGAGGSAGHLFGEGEGSFEERGRNVTDNLGTVAAGAALPAALSGVGKVASKGVQRMNRPEVQRLREKGVQPTVGQTLGGSFNRLEEAAQAVPFLGVRKARERAQGEWRKSFFDDALAPLGKKVDDADPQQMMIQAQRAVDDAYDSARALMPDGIVVNNGFRESLGAIKTKVADGGYGLNGDELRDFNRVWKNMQPLFANKGKVSQKDLQKIDQALSSTAGKSNASKELKQAVGDLRATFSDYVGSKNSAYKEAYGKAQESFMGLARLRDAAAKDAEGAFTPGQAVTATRKQDKSASKGTTGEGYLQREAQDARRVLGDKVRDSGTAENLIAAGGGGSGIVGLLTGAVSPLTAAAGAGVIGAGRLGSGRGAQKTIVDALMGTGKVTDMVGQRGGALGMLSPILAEQEE
jgi:hypothetical protein